MLTTPRAHRSRDLALALFALLAVVGCPSAATAAPVPPPSSHSCDAPLPADGSLYQGHYRVKVGSGTIDGTTGDDFLIGSAGPDTISGGYGNDIVCAQGGNDVIYGGGLGDDLHGGDGDDSIFGELLDDDLFGDAGRDLLVGGHGTDYMDGGINNDWLRGGTNVDTYVGGENPAANNDNDVASFATATPSGGKLAGFTGVAVNMTGSAANLPGVDPHTAIGEGTDLVYDVESVIGSAFDDVIAAPAGEPNQQLYGGMGNDQCNGGACIAPVHGELSQPFAYLDTYSPFSNGTPTPDPAFIVVGGAANEGLALSNPAADFRVSASANGSPEQLATDTVACNRPSNGTVACPLAKPIGGAAMAFGGDGNDTITLANQFVNGMTADFDGGNGNDSLTGSTGSEVLFSGNTGTDALQGGDGGDALLALGSGGDSLDAGPGNDQLVTNDPCQGHIFRGGTGQDVAGFARTNPPTSVNANWGINAQLGNPMGNPADINSTYYGHARLLGMDGTGNACAGATFTYVAADNEILEGTMKKDTLVGNDSPNTLWGRKMDDQLFGAGGDDILRGDEGNDTLSGSTGADRFQGGTGFDHLNAADGRADTELDCGPTPGTPDGGVIDSKDPVDPPGNNC
jgi:Ca2+-binding RTX toxin-like protein